VCPRPRAPHTRGPPPLLYSLRGESTLWVHLVRALRNSVDYDYFARFPMIHSRSRSRVALLRLYRIHGSFRSCLHAQWIHYTLQGVAPLPTLAQKPLSGFMNAADSFAGLRPLLAPLCSMYSRPIAAA
jgi:hypothetical protein